MQTAIITGAGSGIGLAAAKMLYDAGMAIVGIGRDAAKLETLATTLGDPARLATLSVDVTADDAPQAIVQLALHRFGRIDFTGNLVVLVWLSMQFLSTPRGDKPLEAIHLLDIVLAVEPANRDALAVKKASLEHLLVACANYNLSETKWLKSEISAVEAAYQ